MVWHKLKITLEMIKFEHTIFALPFALIAALIAADGLPETKQILGILGAMVGGRSSAMTFNRIVDYRYDRTNPRTKGRALPAGKLSIKFAVIFTIAMSLLFIGSAATLNKLCFVLSFPVLAILFSYSYTKRFTSMSHFALGFAIGLAPVGAWIAVTGDLAVSPILIGISVMLWVSGFDIIYSCQDWEFDLKAKLFSIPAKWGIRKALFLSSILHLLTLILLLGIAAVNGLGSAAYLGIAVVAAIFVCEHRMVRTDGSNRLKIAFFNLNGYVGLVLLASFAADILLL